MWVLSVYDKHLQSIMHCRPTPKSSNSKGSSVFSLITAIHAAETGFYNGGKFPRHRFEVSLRSCELKWPRNQYEHGAQTTLEPSSYTLEKFNLYKSYQTLIHSENKSTPSGFTGFLVDSPLRVCASLLRCLRFLLTYSRKTLYRIPPLLQVTFPSTTDRIISFIDWMGSW